MKQIKHFPISYLGNKSKDYKHFSDLLPNDKLIIVEPFGGSFAVSRLKYYDDKYKKHVNDLSQPLYKLYDAFKNDSERINKLFDDIKIFIDNEFIKYNINGVKNTFVKPHAFWEYIKNYDYIEEIKEIIKENVMVRGMLNKRPNLKYNDFFDFCKSIDFTNSDYKIILDQYEHNKDAFLFIDPPYLDSHNTSYQNMKDKRSKEKYIIDNTEMFVVLSEYIKKCECKVMIILNNNAIIRHLFKDYVKQIYKKNYDISNSKTEHLIICNY